MPRYYFNLRSPSGAIPDLEGKDFRTLAQAMGEASLLAREICAASPLSAGGEQAVVVTDEDEAVLGTVLCGERTPAP